jgi:competence protein ComEA
MFRALFASLVICLLLVTPASPAAQSKPGQATKAAPAVVNLNTATSSQIEMLPGVGASTAKRIIEYRDKNGGFKKIEELMNVKGIGEKSFLKLKSLVTVGDVKASAAK